MGKVIKGHSGFGPTHGLGLEKIRRSWFISAPSALCVKSQIIVILLSK